MPSFGSFVHAVSVGNIFLEINQSEKNHFLWRSCLLTDRDKMCILHKGPSIDASYQVSIHLAE
jgi:hypothetical protein